MTCSDLLHGRCLGLSPEEPAQGVHTFYLTHHYRSPLMLPKRDTDMAVLPSSLCCFSVCTAFQSVLPSRFTSFQSVLPSSLYCLPVCEPNGPSLWTTRTQFTHARLCPSPERRMAPTPHLSTLSVLVEHSGRCAIFPVNTILKGFAACL